MENSLFSNKTKTLIRDLFFPHKNIKIYPLGKLSPEVCAIYSENNKEYIGKLYMESSHSIGMLNCMLQWNRKINVSDKILSPGYIKNINGDYFSKISIENNAYHIYVMPKIVYKKIFIKKIEDYGKIGKSLALLHKASESIRWNHGKIFDFSFTNDEVESYWKLQNSKEKELFDKILKIGVHSKFNNFPMQITHNDIHPENMLKFGKKVLFLDFDQMIIGPRVNDIGQILSSFRLDEKMSTFKKSVEFFLDEYTKIMLLTPEEIDLIPYFALRKLCISYVWFKGNISKNNGKECDLYKIISSRAFNLGKYLKIIQ